MDFFEQQDRARRKTGLLVVYFAMAIVGIIVVFQIIFSQLLGLPWSDLELFAWVAGGVLVLVMGGMLTKMASLSGGGSAVAAMLGGEPVNLHSSDPDEQRLVNVVEEMAIASGVPVPEIFLLPDPAINAFAAGHGPGDTAIGVTRGAVERLTRDELQGVIAHEFSHILNGDMRLNIRLIGLLNGILCIAFLGSFLMRSTFFMPPGGVRRDDGRSSGGGIVFFLFAAGISAYLVGWIGVFFGNLIKAAVSRQREFLADASAVQFTRNPDGIAGALYKIGKFTGRLSSPHAAEASHMYFGNGVGSTLFSLFATHPPIPERIAAIHPTFDPSGVKKVAPRRTDPPVEQGATPPPLPRASQFGRIQIPEIGFAAALLASIPEFGRQAAHEIHSAVCLVYALLLSADEDLRKRQLELLDLPGGQLRETMVLFDRRGEVAGPARIALIDLSIATLRQLSHEQYAAFRANLRRLVEADEQIDLFEFVLEKILIRHLDLAFSNQTGARVRYRSIVPVVHEVGALLSAVSCTGHTDLPRQEEAFRVGVRQLLFKPSSVELKLRHDVGIAELDRVLDTLGEASMEVRRTVLGACAHCAATDDEITDHEYELLRAIADALDCPMPPLPRSDTQSGGEVNGPLA